LEFVQEMPTYPGGQDAMFEVIFDHLLYPEYEKSMNIEGTVLIQFIIEKDGTPTNFKIFRGVANGAGLDSAALMACKQLGRFNPGKQDGIPQRVYSGMPIKFSLADEEEPAEERLSKADLKEIKKDAKYICDMMFKLIEAQRSGDEKKSKKLTDEFEKQAVTLEKKYVRGGEMEKELEKLVKPCLEEAMKAAMGK
jgi:TonB family protein